MFIVGSRNLSQWLDGQVGMSAQAFEEGNPLDRIISSALILLAIGILMSRSFKWGAFFARNLSLIAFVFFALVSVCWSDFPFVAFKRWFRDLGNYLVILVVLSDPRPLEAVRVVLRRLSYLLVPLSILLIKYYSAYREALLILDGRSRVRGSCDKQEHARSCVPDQRPLFLLGYCDALARTQTTADETDHSCERRVYCNDALVAESSPQYDLRRLLVPSAALVIAAAHSRFFKRRNPAF